VSAIYGILRFDGSAVAPGDMARMARVLAHRAPHGGEHVAFDALALGHGLLRVNREDAHEAQPIHDPGLGVTLVADLRLDNREAIAAQAGIDAAALAEMSDSAVLLEAWRLWGENCVDHLVGDFVFALWDARARKLHLVRDAMGQRGLYLHKGERFLAFASEVKALWAVDGVPRRLSERGLGRRLLGPVDPDPDCTLYEGVTVLPGGTIRSYGLDGRQVERRYWEPRADPEHVGRDEAYYIDAYRRIVGEAIACRVRRLDTAPGLLFSGGFDSGIIATVAGPIVAGEGRRIVALASVLPPGEKRRVRDARAAVEAFAGAPGLDIHIYTRGDDSMFSDLEVCFDQYEDSRGTDYVRRAAFRLARDHGGRLVMDGHGGDYTVNVRAPAMLGRILRNGELRRFWRELRARRAFTGWSATRIWRDEVLRAFVPRWFELAVRRVLRGGSPLWRTRMARAAFARRLIARGDIAQHRLRHGSVAHACWRARWLHMLNKMALSPAPHNALAAAHELDFTRPFHDRRVVELGLAIPQDLQLRDGRERWLARTAFAGRLPRRLLESGPGNDQEQPDMFRMVAESAPAALARAREADRGGQISRYVDLDRVAAALDSAREARLSEQGAAHVAANALAAAHFIAWFERANS
jgi:asparagine synthase (glutamine-hydrolysing)